MIFSVIYISGSDVCLSRNSRRCINTDIQYLITDDSIQIRFNATLSFFFFFGSVSPIVCILNYCAICRTVILEYGLCLGEKVLYGAERPIHHSFPNTPISVPALVAPFPSARRLAVLVGAIRLKYLSGDARLHGGSDAVISFSVQ